MILDDIVESTKKRIAKEKREISFLEYRRSAEELMKREEKLKREGVRSVPTTMEEVLGKEGIHLICEVKKASPSKGIIAKDFDYISIAKEYEAAGAAAISVLTEPNFFLGDLLYLEEIRNEVHIPLLRKDFIIDEYQIYQAKAKGASCVLLICSILSEEKIKHFVQMCEEVGISALVEIHDEKEAEVALKAKAKIVGVNNRNLRDFTVDIDHSLKLRSYIPRNVLFVAESGIKSSSDIRKLYDANVNGVLIGETMMLSKDKTAKLQELLQEIPNGEGGQ